MKPARPLVPTLCAVAMAVSAAPARAGIDFAKMPVGCQWTLHYSTGQDWTDTYTGRVQGRYNLRTTVTGNSRKLVKNTRFNDRGEMVETIWANGKWEKSTPFSCYDVSGRCSFVYSNADGQRIRVEQTVRFHGGRYHVKARQPGKGWYPEETFTLGRFGMMMTNHYSSGSFRVTGFRNWGAGG